METTLVYQGIYRGYVGIMEKKMKTTIVYRGIYRGYVGIMEKKTETTIMGLYRLSPHLTYGEKTAVSVKA